MPSKKKKYNARFPAGRIKKIMQSDEEVGKVAQAVPIIISRTLELFVESLLKKTLRITNARNAKTLSPSHMKQCIMSENRFDFLRELVKNIPDISIADECGHDSSPGLTSSSSSSSLMDNSMQPYDLSVNKQQTASSPISFATNLISSNGSTESNGATSSTIGNIDFHFDLKQQWDNVHARRKKHLNKNSTERTSTLTSESSDNLSNEVEDCTPAKMPRIDMLEKFNEDNSVDKVNLKLKHVPCSSKDDFTQKISFSSEKLIPAPIVTTENICNKPVVKIDYSNLALHDNDSLKTTSSLSDKINISKKNINITPVINIDLSNITSTSSSVSTKSASTSPLCLTSTYDSKKVKEKDKYFIKIPQSLTTNKTELKSSDKLNFNLDEDYDNI